MVAKRAMKFMVSLSKSMDMMKFVPVSYNTFGPSTICDRNFYSIGQKHCNILYYTLTQNQAI